MWELLFGDLEIAQYLTLRDVYRFSETSKRYVEMGNKSHSIKIKNIYLFYRVLEEKERFPHLKKIKCNEFLFSKIPILLKNCPLLTQLDLSDLDIPFQDFKKLSGHLSQHLCLTQLDLSYNRIGFECFPFLIQFLNTFPNLRHVYLDSCELNLFHEWGEGWKYTQCLETLSLQNNYFNTKSCLSLQKILQQSPKLKELDISYNWIGDEGFELFSKELNIHCPLLEILCLKQTRITKRSIQCLSKYKWSRLKHLNISYNNIRNEGMEELCYWVKKGFLPNIERIYVFRSQLRDDSLKYIREIMDVYQEKFPKLTQFLIFYNRFSFMECKKFESCVDQYPIQFFIKK